MPERHRIEGTGDDGDARHEAPSVSSRSEGPPLAAVADLLADWFLIGPVLRRRAAGPLILAAVLGFGLATGTTAAAAQLLAGAFWRKGREGTALALAAAAVVEASRPRRRHLTVEEYGWADRAVFAGTLPDRRSVVVTDIAGVAGRAFTFPGIGGTITVNLGTAAFDDPLARPGLLLHELTHAWQIAHTPRTRWLVTAVATQAVDLVTHAAYRIPPPGRSFARFNPEQQAMIVQRWWSEGAVETDPYFPYIERNVRRGLP